ncbi:hypothetical protein ACQJBY_070952 [Aegilops geniculata]
MYKKKNTPLEQILLRPDTHVGSVEKHTQTLWVYEGGAMVHRSVTYIPGLHKIFDEILLQAADNLQRDPSMDSLRVDIDVEGCRISVYNNGNGVPVEIHQEEGLYVPEMMRTSYGAILANIFSTEFVIETADGHRQKKFKQVFSENMGKKSEPQITECLPLENWTRVTFKPDLAKFNMTDLEDDAMALMRKRVVDMAGILGETVMVELNGEKLSAKSFSDYVQLYIDSASTATHQGSFGSKCELSEDFLNRVSNSGVVSKLLPSAEFGVSKELNKTDGSKRTSFVGIPKLEDADDAGGRDSEKCTLILTERDSAKTLADVHGSHIKGLLINFIHSFWPSLHKVPSFLVEFITLIIKITNNMSKSVRSFYSMPDYEAWKEKLGGNSSLWSINYYKELGTSTTQEGGEYFEDIDHHEKDFVWADDKDGECIELVFSKERIAGRKEWQHIKYSDFINKELILFPMADLESSVPSMVDGLKRGQRKVLFCSFKRNFVEEAFVTQLIGYASAHSAYSKQSLASIIIGMAQDFVGSNNISLLEPQGLFGTRHLGGKDAGSTEDLYTRLPPVTRLIFPKDDDILLNYLNEDGQSIEPSWYMPVIPMVLVNGSEDMGTGYVPNYNPRDIIANLKRMLNKEPVIPMDPWYKGFQGSLTKTRSKETGVTYTFTGVIEEVDCRKLHITELPVRCWTADYEHFLKSMCPHKEKEKGKGMDKDKEPPFLERYRSRCSHADVDFKVILSEENMNIAKQEGLEKKFKLTTTIGTTMYLFDSHGKIRKYDTPEDVLEEFFDLRLEFYARRKAVLVENIRKEVLKVKNKVRFILASISRDIIIINRKRVELLLELKRKEYPPFPEKNPIEEIFDNRLAEAAAGVNASDYHYLFVALFTENVPDLIAQQEKLEGELESLLNTEPEILWLRDLDALEKELDVLDAKFEAQQEQRRYEHQHIFSKGAKASTTAPRIQPEKATANSQKANLSVGDNEEHAATFLTAAQNKKPPKKASAPVRDDDEGSSALRDCLAASILPEPSAMEAQTKEELQKGKNEPSKRHASEKAMPSLTEFSEEDMEGEDEEFPMEIEKETIGGKAAAEMPKTAIRKRVPAEREGMRHKVMEEIFKPTDDSSGASPEKKRRCKR